MARMEQDREDLYREATAYVIRGELSVPYLADVVFVGWRKEGACSFYFGADPVYQFNSRGALRRAYHAGALYRTQGETLARMHRVRDPRVTTLARIDLSGEELSRFQSQVREDLLRLRAAIAQSQADVMRATIAAEEFALRVVSACEQVLQSADFLAPRIPGKR